MKRADHWPATGTKGAKQSKAFPCCFPPDATRPLKGSRISAQNVLQVNKSVMEDVLQEVVAWIQELESELSDHVSLWENLVFGNETSSSFFTLQLLQIEQIMGPIQHALGKLKILEDTIHESLEEPTTKAVEALRKMMITLCQKFVQPFQLDEITSALLQQNDEMVELEGRANSDQRGEIGLLATHVDECGEWPSSSASVVQKTGERDASDIRLRECDFSSYKLSRDSGLESELPINIESKASEGESSCLDLHLCQEEIDSSGASVNPQGGPGRFSPHPLKQQDTVTTKCAPDPQEEAPNSSGPSRISRDVRKQPEELIANDLDQGEHLQPESWISESNPSNNYDPRATTPSGSRESTDGASDVSGSSTIRLSSRSETASLDHVGAPTVGYDTRETAPGNVDGMTSYWLRILGSLMVASNKQLHLLLELVNM